MENEMEHETESGFIMCFPRGKDLRALGVPFGEAL